MKSTLILLAALSSTCSAALGKLGVFGDSVKVSLNGDSAVTVYFDAGPELSSKYNEFRLKLETHYVHAGSATARITKGSVGSIYMSFPGGKGLCSDLVTDGSISESEMKQKYSPNTNECLLMLMSASTLRATELGGVPQELGTMVSIKSSKVATELVNAGQEISSLKSNGYYLVPGKKMVYGHRGVFQKYIDLPDYANNDLKETPLKESLTPVKYASYELTSKYASVGATLLPFMGVGIRAEFGVSHGSFEQSYGLGAYHVLPHVWLPGYWKISSSAKAVASFGLNGDYRSVRLSSTTTLETNGGYGLGAVVGYGSSGAIFGVSITCTPAQIASSF